MEKCDRCSERAAVLLPYGPHSFCGKHFLRFFEKRVRRTIRMNKMVSKGEKIAVAVSGGKDSLATAYLLKNIFGKRNEIAAITVDEGIPGYRDKAIKIAKKNLQDWKIQHYVVDMKKELGYSMMDIAKKLQKNKSLGGSCSYCGVFRRMLFNRKARELGCKKIATGHNQDDEAQSILMNILDNDVGRLSRLGAVATGNSRLLVPRIKPLYETPEKDVITYTSLMGWNAYSGECCPFSWQAKRNAFRKTLNELEEKFPGTKYSLLSFFKKTKKSFEGLSSGKEASCCESCGEPSAGKKCKSCVQLERLGNN